MTDYSTRFGKEEKQEEHKFEKGQTVWVVYMVGPDYPVLEGEIHDVRDNGRVVIDSDQPFGTVYRTPSMPSGDEHSYHTLIFLCPEDAENYRRTLL
jgi:hypothetical protein